MNETPPTGQSPQISRRGLLGAGAGLASATLLAPAAAAAATHGSKPKPKPKAKPTCKPAAPTGPEPLLPSERIGLQLYSVRDKVAEIGFGRVFERVAAIGYQNVEFNGLTQGSTPEITPKQLRKELDANGLTGIGNLAIATSAPPPSQAQFEQMLDDAQTLGLGQIGVSFVVPPSQTVSGWKTVAESFNHLGSLAAKRGLGFYVHNHYQEWAPLTDAPSKRGEDILLSETDPRHVFFEMDIYWAFVGRWNAGKPLDFDPLRDYLIPHRARYLMLHVKDGLPDNQTGSNPLAAVDDITDDGEGHIDYVSFFSRLLHESPNQKQERWYIVERDNANSHPRGSLAASQISYLYLRYGIFPGMSFGGMT